MEKTTTIVLTIETRERLKALGKKGETYEKIVRKILDDQNLRI